MAGGIDWFRWHHGSVNDPKFGLVAKKAGASVAEVIATWACLLEAASTADDRGNPGEPDFEAIDFGLQMDDGTAHRIYEQMTGRGLVSEEGRIAAWEKRQPKRERDDNSADRVRAFRERQRQPEPSNDSETSCNATERTETPREEKSREEEKTCASGDARRPTGFDQFWSAYPKKRNKGDAEKAWAKVKPRAELLDRILQAVEVAKDCDDWRKDGGQYIPYPASWLNAKGWEDEPEINGSSHGISACEGAI